MPPAAHRRREDRPRWHGWALFAAALAMLAGAVGFFVQVGIEVYGVAEALRTGVAPTGLTTWGAIWPLAAALIVAISITAVVEKADKPAEYANVLATIEGGQS